MSSEKLSPFGNVLGFIGFFSGFYLGWKNSDGNVLVAFIVGCIIAYLGAAIGNLLWQVLIVALSIVVIYVQRTATREVIVKPIISSFTETTQKEKPRPATTQTYKPRVTVSERQIYINNTCKYGIKLAVRYQDTDGNWTTRAWYNIGPNTNTRLLSDQVPLKTKNATFYYYARVPGFNYSWHGDEVRYYGSEELPMRKVKLVQDPDGDYLCTIHCNNFDEEVDSETAGRIFFRNDCYSPVKIVIRYEDFNGRWTTLSYSNMAANQGSFLANADNLHIRAANSTIYFYAESLDNSLEWKGDETFSHNGQELAMRKIVMSGTNADGYTLAIQCNSGQ